MNECVQEPAVITETQVQQLVANAHAAQAVFESFSQEQVDAIVKGIGKYVYDNAEMLARMAVDETGIGVYEDKILKNKGKARVIWNNLKDKKSRGIIGEDADTNMVFVAKPMGVVGAVTPVTNPIVTPMCNAMFAIKTGNAVIFAPHPKAEKCTDHLTDAFMKVVKANGGPDHLIQMVKKGSIEMTQELMKAVDVVVATGGGAMVKSAYSSGRPSFGVGAGNVPVIIDRDVDVKDAVEKIVLGASFDNGIICSHEQFVLAPEEKYADVLKAFMAIGKVWFTEDKATIQKLREVVFYGLTRGDWLRGFLAALTLAMAILPEELPVVLTVFLALGAWRMSRNRVLTRRMPAIEMLGAATALCVDKTGTLTMNRMSVTRLYVKGETFDFTTQPVSAVPEQFHELAEFGMLASQPDPFDPMDRAIKEDG